GVARTPLATQVTVQAVGHGPFHTKPVAVVDRSCGEEAPLKVTLAGTAKGTAKWASSSADELAEKLPRCSNSPEQWAARAWALCPWGLSGRRWTGRTPGT